MKGEREHKLALRLVSYFSNHSNTHQRSLLSWHLFPFANHLLTCPTRFKGHENMGIVEELGDGVTLLKKGDRVVMPFNVADGRCRNCEEGKTAFCTGVNPGFAGGNPPSQLSSFVPSIPPSPLSH